MGNEGGTAASAVNKGLEGIHVAESRLTFIDGIQGRMLYRGMDIADLATHSSFEETVYFLWNGNLPTRTQLSAFKAELSADRALPDGIIALLRGMPKGIAPMAALRTAVSALALYDDASEKMTEEANHRKGRLLVARMATIVAAFDRIRNGKDPIPPDDALDHAANFLYMLTGERPAAEAVKVVDAYLVLLADHGFNASTFAARVTVSTLSDMYSGVTSAIGALKGPLHGAANQEAMKMLLEIGSVENTAPWLAKAFANKYRIMGFGHRVYKTMDPRATVFKKMAKALCEKAGRGDLYRMSEIIEEAMHKEKNLYPNVDFYSAAALYLTGIPIDLFVMLFAVSRVSGWVAHIMEQYADNRLIRPTEEYIGPKDRAYIPIDKRG